MFSDFFAPTFRRMRKQAGYVCLNVIGLAIGLTAFLFIMLYVFHESGYDRFHRNYENTYRIKIVGQMAGGKLDQAVTAAPMAQALINDYPEIQRVTRVTDMGAWLLKVGDKKFNEEKILFADSSFFSVLDFKLLQGDPQSALVRPRSMVMTEDFARKYFGNEDPIGKTIIVEQDTVLYTVTGVVQNVPDNSHIKFDALGSLSSYPNQMNNPIWVSHNFYTYVTIHPDADPKALEAKMDDMIFKYVGPQLKQVIGLTIDEFRQAGNDFRYVLEPLKDLHLKGAPQDSPEPLGSPTTVNIMAAIAILILIIAIINYINLATAKSAGRAREVGIKKVSGADKRGLIVQFIGESLIIVTMATVLALLLVLALTPAFNQLTGTELAVSLFNPTGLLFLIGLIIVVGVAAGAYPAFVLASFNPASVLKGSMNPGSMSKTLRGTLVTIQFTVSIVIIIGSMVIYDQINFLTHKNIGFPKENLIVINRVDAFYRQRESFRSQLLGLSGVQQVGFSTAVPGIPGGQYSNNGFLKDDDPEKQAYLLNQGRVSIGFPEALGVELVAGRYFSKDFSTDTLAVMINETAAKQLGWADPLDKYILQPSGPNQFNRLRIIGVMKDFNIESMHQPITPVCFTILPPRAGDQFALVRLTGSDVQGTIREIEKIWQQYTPMQPFQYSFFTDCWNALYSSEAKTAKIFVLFSALGIFISCLGLLALVTYITNKRTREIGIRKTYGATTGIVLRILSREVVYIIMISSLVAYPLAFFGARYWLEGFADKVSVSPLVYILATLVTLAVGWLSISYQTIKAANYNPVEALRIE